MYWYSQVLELKLLCVYHVSMLLASVYRGFAVGYGTRVSTNHSWKRMACVLRWSTTKFDWIYYAFVVSEGLRSHYAQAGDPHSLDFSRIGYPTMVPRATLDSVPQGAAGLHLLALQGSWRLLVRKLWIRCIEPASLISKASLTYPFRWTSISTKVPTKVCLLVQNNAVHQ